MTISRRRVLRAGAAAAFAVLLAAFARHVNWHSVGAAVRDADPWLLFAAVVINLVSLALKGVRWWVFLRPLGVRSLTLVLRATFAGASLNNLVVAQGGEGARVLLVSRASGVSSAQVAAALALERVLDAISYLVLLVSATWMFELPEVLSRLRIISSVLLVSVAVALVAVGELARRGVLAFDAGQAADRRVQSYLRRFATSLASLGTSSRLAAAMALSLGAWALQVATYHLVARAAHLDVPLAASVAAMLTVGVSFLVRATPGNVGVFQVIYALTMRSFGVANGAAVAVSLLLQMLQVIPTIVIGTLVTPLGPVRLTTRGSSS